MLAGIPSLKVVNVTRDPRAIAASRNFGDYVTKQGGGKKHPILLLARMWRTSFRYRQSLKEHYPGRFYPLTYENLMDRPHEELPLLCEFLDIPFEANMLDFESYRDEQGQLWSHNSSFGSSNGFDPSSSHRWEQFLPDDYQACLEFLLFHEMRELGYGPRMSAAESLNAFIRFTEDLDELSDWTLSTDLILDNQQKAIEISRYEQIESNNKLR